MKLSFLLPTNRPVSGILGTIKNIRDVWTGFDHELLVCSPTRVAVDGVTWIQDTFGGFGSVSPINAMARMATGKYLMVANDDIQFSLKAPKIIDFLESSAFNSKKYKLSAIPVEWSARVQHWRNGGLNMTVCHYPCISRTTINDQFGGYFFHPGFRHHCCDHWLSYYAYANGEPLVSPTLETCITDTKWQQRNDQDRFDYRILDLLIASYKVGYPYYF